MAAYNIGPRIGIEGEKEFRAQISRINKEYSAMESYTKAVSTAMQQQGKSQELLASKSNALQQQIAQQQQKYKLLTDALAKVQAKTGENSQETLRYKGALLDVENTLSSLQSALAETAQEMTDLANGVQHIETAAERAERNLGEYRQQMARLNDEYDAATTYTQAVSRGMDATGASMEGLSNKATGLYRQLDLQRQRFENLHNSLRAATELYGENSAEVLRFEAALEDVKTSTSALQRELDATDDELRRMADGIEDVGDAAEVADDKVLSFGDVVKAGVTSGMILDGLERAGDMILEIGSQAIEAAADVKAANAQFSQTFGNLESTARQALEGISEDTGIATTRLQGAYTSLYAFTKSVGGDTDAALNIAQRAMTAAADSAAYYDRSVEDATETLQSFLKGNYENDAALGIAATETTRNAMANKLYAKSFIELSESQKVDTLLAMVEAGNQASGAMGQAAREADSWANVTGELSEAWRQMMAIIGNDILSDVTPILQGITTALNYITRETSYDRLNQGIQDFKDGLEAAETALADSNAEIASTSALAERYVARLRDLEGAGLDTAESQREYAQTVELLNDLMPDLNLTINENTGRLDQNTWAIEQNIQALKNQAEQQAKMTYYKSIMDEYQKALDEQFAAEMRLIQLQEREVVLAGELEQAARDYAAAAEAGAEAQDEARPRLAKLSDEMARNRAEQADLTTAIAEGTATLAEHESTLDYAEKAYAKLAGETQGAAGAADALTEAYQSAKAAARESIESQIGLFEELAEESEMSAEEIVENWKKQQTAFTQYGDNLKKAVELGLDETLIRQLSDGSQQSMLILDELVNGTELTIDEINAAFRDRMDAEDYFAESYARMESIMADSHNRMITESKKSGAFIIDGIVMGIYERMPRLEQASATAARKTEIAFNRTIEINSPSRVMVRSGGYVIAGVVQGVERETPNLERAMADAAKSANAAYLQEQLDYTAQYPSLVAGAPGYGGGTTTNNRSVTYGGISININAQPGQDVQSIADAVLQKLTIQLGQEEAAF